MQKYKRLTKKGHSNNYIQNCSNCDLKDTKKCNTSNCNSLILNRLGELEDKFAELEVTSHTNLPKCKNCTQKEWIGDYALDWCEKARKVVDDNTYCHCPQYFKCKGE